MAIALGPFVRIGVPLLMVNAAVLGTTAISLSSAWAFSEVRGWKHSLQKNVREILMALLVLYSILQKSGILGH